jgi:hypothetical protein
LQRRPNRPDVLDDGAWRALLAHEQIGTAWAAEQPATRT